MANNKDIAERIKMRDEDFFDDEIRFQVRKASSLRAGCGARSLGGQTRTTSLPNSAVFQSFHISLRLRVLSEACFEQIELRPVLPGWLGAGDKGGEGAFWVEGYCRAMAEAQTQESKKESTGESLQGELPAEATDEFSLSEARWVIWSLSSKTPSNYLASPAFVVKVLSLSTPIPELCG
uniref:Uncharacterized protein n=1 Tax=Sphaerodactylus townsendi TaxID=933632 RepID=A0ACB8ELS2_9SAUR